MARSSYCAQDGRPVADGACVPCDGSFEPELIRKGQTRIDGMDDKIIRLYAAGLSTRDIRAHLEEVYGLRVFADLISRVTTACHAKVCSGFAIKDTANKEIKRRSGSY